MVNQSNPTNPSNQNKQTSLKEAPTIQEALEILDFAAKQKKDELKGEIVNKYHSVRDVFQEEANGSIHSAKDKVSDIVHKGEAKVEQLFHDSEEMLQRKADELSAKIKKDPLSYAGKIALGALVAGFLLGRSK